MGQSDRNLFLLLPEPGPENLKEKLIKSLISGQFE